MATHSWFSTAIRKTCFGNPVHHGNLLILGACTLLASAASAVIFQNTDDSSFNTTAPAAGELAGSGWEFQGQWGTFTGTPIAPGYFIAARHVGGSLGQTFIFQGTSYLTTAVFDDPASDLRIWQVDGTFPQYAQLYTATNEAGRDMVIIGRGTQRGSEITTTLLATNYITETVDVRTLGLSSKQAKALYPNASFKGNNMTYTQIVLSTNNILNGWQWGAWDSTMRWGKQQVANSTDLYIVGQVNKSSDPNACALTGGDSSGAVFINDGVGWKLAGINYAVEGPFSTTAGGPSFNAALLDKTGLFSDTIYWSPNGAANPSCFYSTRISKRITWIMSVIGQ